ncbi:PAS domain S-box protein [Fortiea contorta]|uniref:PAS domain S-box protein n=1 Tax=Fortiea contorta TaxID=1892405 RepID=UPI000349A2BC|nr:PAS domain S-box protein [Fortiea contorta]
MKILVVEDDELLAAALTAILTHHKYAVEVASDGDVAGDLIAIYDYDLVVLDVMLPKLDGLSLCRQIRSSGRQVPILLLTGRDSSHEKAIGLDAGADDYVVKPFDQEELIARVRALLRRGGATSQPILEWGNLRLDPSSCQVIYGEDLLSLTPKEYGLLELFLRNSRRVFSCGMILEHLWSYDDTPTEEAVRTHIKGLRQKLKAVGAPHDLIETVYGVGYRLKTRKDKAEIKHFSPQQQQTLKAVAGIWEQFQGRVDQQVRVLEAAVTNPQWRSLAAQEAHTLAGALGTFGLAEGSQLARKIAVLLADEQSPTPTVIEDLDDLVRRLRGEIAAKNQVSPPAPDLVSQPMGEEVQIQSRQISLDEGRWRAMWDAKPDGVVAIAADGTVLEINPAGLLIWEADSSAVIGKSIYPLIAPEYHEAFRTLNHSVCQGHQATLPLEMINSKGNRRWMEVHAVPLRYTADGQVVQLAIMRDLTLARQTQAQMQRLHRTLKTLISCHQILVRSKEESDLLQRICQVIIQMGGYRWAWVGQADHDLQRSIRPVAQAGDLDEDLLFYNMTWAETIPGQNPSGIAIRTGRTCIIQNISTAADDPIWRSPASKQGYAASIALPLIVESQSWGALNIYAAEPDAFDTDEVKLLHELTADLAYGIEALHNQRDRTVAQTALQQSQAALQQANNQLELRVAQRTAELVGLNQQLQSQLDERQRIQAQLRISQAKFARILDIADDAIISIDSQQRITLFNQGAEKIFGYSAQEVMGQPLDLLLPLRFAQEHRHHVADFGKSRSLARTMGERREIFGCRRDGTEFPAEASISKLDMGHEIFYTVILRDITQRKQIERMKDEFVSVVSHELRTPLTSIHGSLGMLASGLLTADSEAGKRLLQIATDSSDRLVRLINDILDIERIESGRVTTTLTTCNLDDLIKSTLNVMQPLADQAGVRLEISSLSIQISADQDRIVQTLTNLLSNAIKFSGTGSTVWLQAQIQEDEVLLAVKDIGRGIPTDKLESIFERFQQVDCSDARNHDGTGLGLAICKSIVQQHGGRIWAESILGEGSSFYFTLPILKN